MTTRMTWIAGLVTVTLGLGSAAAWRLTEKPAKPVPFSSLPQRDRNLAVYDAFVDQLHEHYYEPKLLKTDEWRTRLEEFRAKAAAAPDSGHLYTDVLQQLAHSFPDSHVEAMGPANPAAASPPAPASSPAPAPAPAPIQERHSPGFEFVTLRRGKRVNFMVGDVDSNSPADRAGVAPGYAILNLHVDTTSTSTHVKADFERHPPDEVRSMERDFKVNVPGYKDVPATAEAQTKAFIAERRFSVEYDYASPPIPTFEHRMVGDAITYVRFDNFEDPALIDRVLEVIDKAPANGLIVDLRHNGGGLSTETHRVLNRLLGHDAYIGTHRRGWWFENLRTDKEGPVYTGPLVLLIGPHSASAAEITAAAVLDNKRGLLIGRMTSGSVMESNYFPLPDGGVAQIPVNDYVRGGDRRIDGVGIEPDIWILPTLEDVRAGRDPVLDRAIQELKTQKS